MASILIVDDQPANRDLIVTLIGYQGHRALEASDGLEALALARAERPQLIISDILMPTMDGFEFVRRLRADRELAQTEVIFYTAHYHEREARNLARACGVTRVLTKPCEPEVILEAIEQSLGRQPPAESVPDEVQFDREHLRLMTDMLSAKVDALSAANQRLAALNECNLELASQRDPHALLENVCRTARDLIGAQYAILCAGGTGAGKGALFTTSGIDAALAEALIPLDVGHGVPGQVFMSRRAQRWTHPESASGPSGLPPGYPPLHSGLAAPVVSLSKSYGWICLVNKLGAEDFSDDDQSVLTALCALAGRIYENGSLYVEIVANAEKLRESERRFGDMLRNVHLISLMLDREGTITFCNDYLLRLTGWRREEVVGKNWFELFVPADDLHRKTLFQDLLNDIPDMRHHESEILTRSGGRRRIQWSNTVLRSTAGAVIGAASIGDDVTERQRAEEEVRRLNAGLELRVAERTAELEAANRELEAFDYSISHDLRGPLNRIRGFSDMLLQGHGEGLDEGGRDLLRRIADAGKTMDQLVNDLLHLSTVARGELRRSDVDLAAIAHAVVEGLRRAQPDRDVDLVVAAPLVANCDPGLIRPVLENLLGNAWKFTGKRKHARIEVGSEVRSGTRVYFVGDNGAGFDGSRADKLFAPFQRLHAQAEFEGTGIGLATVQRIIRRHGGRAWAEGAVDRGATFHFTLGG